MDGGERYEPGRARGAEVHKEGEKWTLILVRELRHSPEKVWQALTDPAQVREWAPFEADKDLGAAGSTVKLKTLGAPKAPISDTTVTRAEAPRLLEYNWGAQELRWVLEEQDGGTRLTLWHSINRRYIAMGAAGWHVSLDVLDSILSGRPRERNEAMKIGWQRLNAEYAQQFGVETPDWSANGPKS